MSQIKPEKKKYKDEGGYHIDEICSQHNIDGYNQACSDWKKWIASDEFKQKLIEYLSLTFIASSIKISGVRIRNLAKAISKRIRGEG